MFTCVHYLQLDAKTRELSDLSGSKHVQVEASETAMLALAAQLQSQLDISRQQYEERLAGMLIKENLLYTLCVVPSNGGGDSTNTGCECRHSRPGLPHTIRTGMIIPVGLRRMHVTLAAAPVFVHTVITAAKYDVFSTPCFTRISRLAVCSWH